MNTMTFVHVGVACAAGLTLWLFTLALAHMGGAPRRERIQAVLAHTSSQHDRPRLEAEDVLAADVAAQPFHQRIIQPLLRRSTRLALKYAPTRILSTLQRQLDGAGSPRNLTPAELLVAKITGLVAGIVVGILTAGFWFDASAVGRDVVYTIVVAIGGFFVPDLWLYRKRRAHVNGVSRALPDVVDLLRVSMDGGVSFDGAVNYVVAKMRNPLTFELHRYLLDRQVGRGQDEAMEAMSTRANEPDLQSLVEVIIQGEALGTGINRALQSYSKDLRTKRRQRAEKKAHEAAMKMLFPMILFIFPAIFIIILGPTVPLFVKSFGL